jgi:hypothetical protein
MTYINQAPVMDSGSRGKQRPFSSNGCVLLSQAGHKAVSGLYEGYNVADEQAIAKKDSSFDNAWFSRTPAASEPSSAPKKLSPMQRNIEDIKQYAYEAFDSLDANKNGFIEMDELAAHLNDPNVPMREKSFVSFLINNHDDIEKACAEGGATKNGISRLDIEFYFKLVLSQLS